MRLWPDTLAARTLALLLGMTLLLILVSAVLLRDERIQLFDERNRMQMLGRITTLVRLLNDAQGSERQRIIERFMIDGENITLSQQARVAHPANHPVARRINHRIRHDLKMSDPLSVRISDQLAPLNSQRHETDPSLDISIRLRDGIWLNIQPKRPESPPPWASKTLQLLALLLILIIFSALIIARRMARPMAQLADAADHLGLGHTVEPLAESGPREVRQTIRAFNRMQQRLHKHISDRSLMLAAVSHDLRTPVTTLRLRAEYIEDPEIKEKTLVTLAEMEAILSATLSFARDEAADEKARPTDLAALLQSLVDDHVDLGGDASYSGPDKLTFTCRPIALKRALNNLIDNALKYAGSALVHLTKTVDGIEIHIDDHGEGIPEDKLEDLFTPFYRLETSRNRNTGGTGLGLAVARSIVLAHGGELKLENISEGGLRAVIRLPINH